uniref:Immunoglobulin C1-set domain-containing protein n=1 Tax=Leptobrachium leishanense TaxID=445787 RepID=A0A8C5QDE1_9ANUR
MRSFSTCVARPDICAAVLRILTEPDPDYLDQGKCDCHFTNGTERVRFLRDISTTRSLFTSTSGNTLQKPNAGNQFAVPNYDILHSVKISVTASVNDLYQYKHTIICNIFGFYPSGIEVKWFRNEQTTQVRYLGPHSDGDWTYHWAGPRRHFHCCWFFTTEVRNLHYVSSQMNILF